MEEGIIQAALGVGDAASVIILLLRRRRRHRHHHRHRRRRRGIVASLHRHRGRWVRHIRRREWRCHQSIRRDGVVVGNDTTNGSPDAAATATRPDGGVGGSSSTDRDNNDHDADGDRRHCRRPRPPPWAVTAIAVMTIVGKRGGEATARQQQGDGKAKARQRRGDGDVKAIGYGASVGKVD